MNKIKLLIVSILLVFVTGCSSCEFNMKVNKDKSMLFSILVLTDSYDENFSNDIMNYKSQYEQYGFDILEYNEDGVYGVKISKKYDNIDDISKGLRSDEFDLLYLYSNGYDQNIENKMFSLDKGLDTNRYAANFYVDFSNYNINSNATITYTVELPNESLSNNANLVSEDGKTLTWNISSGEKSEIEYVFELKSYDYIYYGIAVVVLIFIVFSIFGNLFGGNKDSEKEDNKKAVNDIYHKNVEVKRNVVISSDNKVISNNVNKSLTKNNTEVKNNENKELSNLITPVKKKKVLFGKKEKNVDVSVKVNNNEEFNTMIENFNNGNIETNKNVTSVYNNNDVLPNPFGNNNTEENTNRNGGFEQWYTSDSSFDNSNNSGIINVEPISQNDASTDVNISTNVNINNSSNINAPLDINYDNQVVNNNVSESDNSDVNINNGPVIRVNSKQVVVSNEKEDV